jgi:serine/threonine-protein kinase HipA
MTLPRKDHTERTLTAELARFYEQVAFTVMVRNGDGHLKNFGVLYSNAADIRLSPMFDVVTTSIYKYQRYDGGPELEDHTMALKLFAGPKGSRVYPSPGVLLDFGRRICGVSNPRAVIERIAKGMAQALALCCDDPRVPAQVLTQLCSAWEPGFVLAKEISRSALMSPTE